MAFITRYLKSGWVNPAAHLLRAIGLMVFLGVAQAQSVAPASQLQVERVDNDVLVSAQVQFSLPPAVEDALQKGVPLFFVTEAEILRQRWYWYAKSVSTAERHLRLAYQPLTRHWRLNAVSGPTGSGPGLSLNQNFDTLAQALAVITRVTRWKIADATNLDVSSKYGVEFRFRLDLTQLPLPLQIGTLGQSDWDVAISMDAPLALDLPK